MHASCRSLIVGIFLTALWLLQYIRPKSAIACSFQGLKRRGTPVRRDVCIAR